MVAARYRRGAQSEALRDPSKFRQTHQRTMGIDSKAAISLPSGQFAQYPVISCVVVGPWPAVSSRPYETSRRRHHSEDGSNCNAKRPQHSRLTPATTRTDPNAAKAALLATFSPGNDYGSSARRFFAVDIYGEFDARSYSFPFCRAGTARCCFESRLAAEICVRWKNPTCLQPMIW